MEKDAERKNLVKVFGDWADHARDHERPDFLLATPSGETLGVEVTSIYSSNSDAKLKRLDGYSEALLTRTRGVHRADQRELRVDDITLLHPDGGVVDTVAAIIQKMPSPVECMRLLFARIAEKEAKIPDYLQSCARIDLIIADESSLFRHRTHEDFYRRNQLLVPRRRLLSSPFREIYLVTGTFDLKEVWIPLIGNAFASDCYAYLSLLSDEASRSEDEIHNKLTAALLNDGHARVKVSRSEAGISYFTGAWEVFIDDEGFAIRDWTVPHSAYLGQSIQEFVAGTLPDVIQAARALTTQKRRSLAMLDMRVPVRTGVGQS
jgi:hypothetical protein